LAQLRQEFEKFLSREAVVLVVGPEDQQKFKNYWEKEELPFVGLPDPNHKVLKLFGQEVNIFKFGRMPAQVIVNKAAMVCYVHYGKSMQDIPDNAELLQLLDSLNQIQVEI
jgi:peroxiredoxin